MGNLSSQPESSIPTVARRGSVQVSLCGTTPIHVVHAEQYVEELWAALDKTLDNSGCGVGSDLPEGQGGTLNLATLQVKSAPAPVVKPIQQPRGPSHPIPPPPPELLPDMKDSLAIKNSTHALSPAVHGPTGTGKSTVFPLAVTHWTYMTKGLKSGFAPNTSAPFPPASTLHWLQPYLESVSHLWHIC